MPMSILKRKPTPTTTPTTPGPGPRPPADAAAAPPPPAGWLARIDSEIRAGLPLEQARRLQAITNLKYYRLHGDELIPRRPGESIADYDARPKLSLPLTRRVVHVLASKLYAPGPAREVRNSPAASAWLQAAYADGHANARWQRADRMAHLNGLCAIQVAATGDRRRPLAFHLWSGRHEVVPFEAPGRANEVAACVTIDCEDERTTYTLWTADEYRTYRTDKLAPGQTAGGRSATFVPEESGANPYGCLPFAFVWHEPLDGGVDAQEGLGRFLANLNASIDVILSDHAQAARLHGQPIPVAYNVDGDSLQLARPGGFLHVVPSTLGETPGAPEARLDYLRPDLDFEGLTAYLNGLIDAELEALGLPLTAYRMDAGSLPSGEALIQEQAPLIEYATERRVGFAAHEAALARVCLTIGGAYYGDPALAAAAADLDLALTWPPITINLPSAARDDQDAHSLAAGYESRTMIVMRRFGLSRDQAEAHLKQVAADEAMLAAIGLPAPTPGAPPPADDGGDGPDGPDPGRDHDA